MLSFTQFYLHESSSSMFFNNLARVLNFQQRESENEWFWQFEPFSKLKKAFCEYWTSVKIKINMTCVSKEYEIKTKIEEEQ